MPPPASEARLFAGARRTETDGDRTIELYPPGYAVESEVVAHLRFALRHEPTDIGIMVAAMKAIDPAVIEGWVLSEPSGAFSRRAWFFYETFVGRMLDLPDAAGGNYVGALDPGRHIVAGRRNSRRHRVVDNLLGGRGLCPVVRRTARLKRQMDLAVDGEARALVAAADPAVLARALGYLYAKETRSSFAIEGETPSAGRVERFVAALRAAPRLDPTDKAAMVALQAAIVDPRYAADDWRDFQTFVGETMGGHREVVHYVCPRPEDVPGLMEGWATLFDRLMDPAIDPVAAAAVASFAFVFIHPFEDGNGRIHRLLIHHVLARRGYSPDGLVLPVSAAIMRDRRGYDRVLEGFSGPLSGLVDWRWTGDREVVVANATGDLYRYFDATAFAEYLHERVLDAVRRDLGEELDFIALFDRALASVRSLVDMPDRRAVLLVQLCLQNDGRLSAAKRPLFAELSAGEVSAIEAAIQGAMAGR
ncbi:Fic family protein [Allostella humosa]|uniref:Fic family protein n=1 Tax=Stella humosa TaxID=94 RepID=UPI001B85E21C|nr:Fic family protein [Stella humosa]